MKAALKRGVDTGVLVQMKNSYKVSAEAKKPIKAKKTVTKPTKPAPMKKKVSGSCRK
jgi:histone H1/5